MPTGTELESKLSALDLLALTMYGEARGLDRAGRLAVGLVVMHRLNDPAHRFGHTVGEIVLAPSQFSCWLAAGGTANFDAVITLAEQIIAGTETNDTLDAMRWLARDLLEDQVLDTVDGANHYLTRELCDRRPPEWAKGHTPVADVSGHVFFRL